MHLCQSLACVFHKREIASETRMETEKGDMKEMFEK